MEHVVNKLIKKKAYAFKCDLSPTFNISDTEWAMPLLRGQFLCSPNTNPFTVPNWPISLLNTEQLH